MTEPEQPAPGNAEERVDLSGLSRLSDQPPPPRGERTVRVLRGLSVMLLAVAAAGLPWYFVTRGGSKEDAGTTKPTHSASPSPSPSASPKAATFEVFNVGTVCLRIREQPSTGAKLVTCLGTGVRLHSDGRTQQAGGRLWRHVFYAPKKMWGWAAAEYLKLVS